MNESSKIKESLNSSYFWVLAVATLVTIPLLAATIVTPRIVEVYIQPDSEDGAKIVTKSVLTKTNGGPAYFDFRAELINTDIKGTVLRIRPIEEDLWYEQKLQVENSHVRGVPQLGSVEYPLKKSEVFSFQLTDIRDEHILTEGKIIAEVDELIVGDPRWITGIALLASLVEICQALVRAFWRKKERAA